MCVTAQVRRRARRSRRSNVSLSNESVSFKELQYRERESTSGKSHDKRCFIRENLKTSSKKKVDAECKEYTCPWIPQILLREIRSSCWCLPSCSRELESKYTGIRGQINGIILKEETTQVCVKDSQYESKPPSNSVEKALCQTHVKSHWRTFRHFNQNVRKKIQ